MTTTIETGAAVLIALHLGVMLTVAGTAKALAPATFTSALHHDSLIPGLAIRLLGTTVPWVELGLGVWLLSGFAGTWSAAMATLTFTCFAGYSAVRMAVGRPASRGCGCFGVWRRPQHHLDAVLGTTINTAVAFIQWRWLSTHLSTSWQVSVTLALLACAGVAWIARRQFRVRTRAHWLRGKTALR